MRALVLAASVAFLLPVRGAEVQGKVVTLDDDEARICTASGDCVLASKAVIEAMIRAKTEKAYEAGQASAEKGCRDRTSYGINKGWI